MGVGLRLWGGGMPEAERVTGHPPGMLQDDSRKLTAGLAGNPDAMRHAREAAEKIQKTRFDGRRVVDYDVNGTPILEGRAVPLPRYDGGEHQCCGALASGPLKPKANRPGAAARARLEATPEGRALLAAAKAHLLECVQLTPLGVDAFAPLLAISMEMRPCRCGGCADSGCPGRR